MLAQGIHLCVYLYWAWKFLLIRLKVGGGEKSDALIARAYTTPPEVNQLTYTWDESSFIIIIVYNVPNSLLAVSQITNFKFNCYN